MDSKSVGLDGGKSGRRAGRRAMGGRGGREEREEEVGGGERGELNLEGLVEDGAGGDGGMEAEPAAAPEGFRVLGGLPRPLRTGTEEARGWFASSSCVPSLGIPALASAPSCFRSSEGACP
jgi:hypothetical protein